MENEKVFAMRFGDVYRALINKTLRKGRTREEADAVIAWMTGYTPERLSSLADSDLTYGDFFRHAPRLHPNREKIAGVVCGVRVEAVADPLMREIRRLDKLIDELAKGKPLEKICRAT